MIDLRSFQKRFLSAALAPGVDSAALSLPRGNGKSTLAAHILTRCLTPGDPLNVPGAEYLLGAASIEQARLTYRPIRAWLEPTGDYRFLDSSQRIGIAHKPTNTRVRVISSSAKRAMGVVGVPLWVMDEPGSYEVVGGELMWDAAATALGKPDSPLKLVLIGTLAPALPGNWWHNLIADGTTGSTYVQALQGDIERWDQWSEIRRCNPLTAVSPAFRKRLLEERDAARADSRLKARFLSYRLNRPTQDEVVTLLTVDEFQRACARPEALPAGRPIVGIDLGGGRAWSAAVAVWPSGRVEALAYAPGIPTLEEQERRDRVPRGTYRRLAQAGILRVADGLRVPLVTEVLDAARGQWGQPDHIVCDRFRLPELLDHARGIQVVPRVTRWSEASADIRGLRKLVLDGPLVPSEGSRPLLAASLAVAMVKADDQGSVRMVKRDASNNTARDDVAAALVLAAGQMHRYLSQPRPSLRYELVSS